MRAHLITVGAYVGAIVGNGILYTAGGGGDRERNVSSMVGSVVGVWFTHRATRGWGERVTHRAAPWRRTTHR